MTTERMNYIKEATGIKHAGCDTCCNIGSDGDGYEYNGTWAICEKHESYCFLKSFPFKKEMPKCWEPNFWASKFVAGVSDFGEWDSKELNYARNLFDKALLA